MTGPIPKKTNSAYEAHGAALAAWQMVETSAYFLIHAALGTDEALSSLVFFHIRSPSAKMNLTADLVCQRLNTDLAKSEWKVIQKRIETATSSRNHLAHFEMMAIVSKSKTTGRVQIEPSLSEPFHDVRTHQRQTVKAYNKSALEVVTVTYIDLARDMLRFVESHFGATALPQELVRKGREQAHNLSRKTPNRPK